MLKYVKYELHVLTAGMNTIESASCCARKVRTTVVQFLCAVFQLELKLFKQNRKVQKLSCYCVLAYVSWKLVDGLCKKGSRGGGSANGSCQGAPGIDAARLAWP